MTDFASPSGAPLSGADIRQKFLDFFESRHGHLKRPSASLVPANNPTVMLTPAGMLPFVPIFLGIEPPPSPPRVVSVQKCARVSGKASDLEAVGRTPRHHTFFEMLGNFSFGDYFKNEVIPWAWEFVTKELGLPPEKLIVSVYETDDEAFAIWLDVVGLPESKIHRLGADSNFWGPPGPTGPCGPCSEIYYDLDNGKDFDDRYLEIWNLVFMELFQEANGSRSPLEKKNVDTGMGLERITALLQGKTNTFETDLLFPILEAVGKAAGISYGQSEATDVALKIVTDHLRFLVFTLADGVTPSNEGRGYIVRMILRRAVRYGKQYLGFTQPQLHTFVDHVIALYGTAYPEIVEKQAAIKDVLQREESRFLETLDRGSGFLTELIEKVQAGKQTTLPGDEVFKLYDTYGFPVELTRDIAQEAGLMVDMDGFDASMEAQRVQARSSRKGDAIVSDTVFADIFKSVGSSTFVGYDLTVSQAKVVALVVDGEPVDSISGTNQPFLCVLESTPFYAESGGQVGDRGTLWQDNGQHSSTAVVQDTQKVGELIVHHCLFDQGEELKVGDSVVAEVDGNARHRSAIHHSATHLLHAALKLVLGDSVNQAGSSVGPEGARFDFTWDKALSRQELQRIEFRINQWIQEDIERHVDEMSVDEAKAAGAVAMFGEKYGETVRVVTYGSHSKELCGGTHIDRLGQIGLVKLTSEGAIASGVRRIEMVAGELALRYMMQEESQLQQITSLLKTNTAELPFRIQRLMDDSKQKDKTILQLQQQVARMEIQQIQEAGPTVPGGPFYVMELSGKSPDVLKAMAEVFQEGPKAPKSYVLVLASDYEGKAHIVSAVSQDMVKQGYKAGDLVKMVATQCGGGGGGRPNFAQAGGKNPENLPSALQQMKDSWAQKVG